MADSAAASGGLGLREQLVKFKPRGTSVELSFYVIRRHGFLSPMAPDLNYPRISKYRKGPVTPGAENKALNASAFAGRRLQAEGASFAAGDAFGSVPKAESMALKGLGGDA